MDRRFLLGPVNRAYADAYLPELAKSQRCHVFDWHGPGVLELTGHHSWASFQDSWPKGWEPSFLVVYLAYRTIPSWLWQAPIPIIGLAPDWNLLWHSYLATISSCDLVLTDTAGVDHFERAGLKHVRFANLFGGDRRWLMPAPEITRDIDVLFVGNLHGAVQRERLPWMTRLARLQDRWNVTIRSRVFGYEYRSLMRRTRVAFNRSVRGEWNMRVFEALASGALLFQEEANIEVPNVLRDREDCILYNDKTLEETIEHYLSDETERSRIAEQGRRRALEFTFERCWEDAEKTIQTNWPLAEYRYRARIAKSPVITLHSRVWQHTSCDASSDDELTTDLKRATHAESAASSSHFLRGVVLTVRNGQSGIDLPAAAESFRLAALHSDCCPLSELNRIETLVLANRHDEAVHSLDGYLRSISGLSGISADKARYPHVPAKFDDFRVAWEAAGWANAGSIKEELAAKKKLLEWRGYILRGQLSNRLDDLFVATTIRPDISASHFLLGQALFARNRHHEAIGPLRTAWEADPFQVETAGMLYRALREARVMRESRRLACDMHRLSKSNPSLAKQDWFAKPGPTGDELASVIIPCWNQVAYTRQCIQSVLRCTHTPFELVVINNGSTDDTTLYLTSVTEAKDAYPFLQRVQILRNEENQGFAIACNQGLKAARGDFLVLLNNDTIVTQGWLTRLVDWSLVNYPQIGLVGPASNYAPPPQYVPFAFTDTSTLEVFARQRNHDFREKAILAQRLTGFCFLFHRDVLQAVGFLDEQFAWGFFEDDDFCARIRAAGFDLLLATDVFIHHFGSRSITELPVSPEALLHENHGKFRAKWGDELADRYRSHSPNQELASTSLALNGTNSDGLSQAVSLCMIVKDEESNLGDCLRSVADLVDEIVIVDTGSTDRTKEIAAEFGAKIFDFPWIDDFAAARNESLRHASKEWIFWMDADDRMDDAGRDAFRRTVAQLSDKVSGYVMKCLCLPDRETGTTTVVDHIRLFRNLPEIRWKYRIHEQILPAIRKLGGEVVWTDVVVHHTGYQELALKSKKRQRDLRLLKLEIHENPDDPFTLFNLGQIHQEEGQLNDALTCFQRSVKLSHPHDSIVRKLYSLMTQILRHQGKPAESLETCLKGKEHYPNDPELLFQEGLTRQDLKDWGGAKDCYGRILAGSSEKFFASSDPGLRSYKARHNMGVVCRELKNDESAEEQWKLAVAEAAHFIPSLNALGELYLAKQRWNELDDIIRRLKIQPSARLTSEILDGRRFLAMKNFKLAQATLESAVQSHPDAQIPRVLLSYVFLQSGDWVAAEALLRDILLRDPNHAESRQNLDLLLSRRLETSSVRPRISLCMIVRNEEAHLGRCLESIRDLVDEIIITDTGSTDGTKSLAERFGARVIDLTWPDSFAHARTESVKSARGEWVLYLDADEFLDNQNRDRFLKLRNNLVPNHVYMMRQVSESASGSGVVWATDHARLFPNLPNLQWTFRVHEQILGFLLGQGCEMTSTDIHIQHSGFVDASLKRQKLQRNLQLLLEDLHDYPDNGFVWFNRATCHLDLGENEEAATCLDRAIRLTLPNVSFVPKAHVLLIMAYRRLGRLDDALAQVERALQHFPSHQEILLEKGAVLAKLDRPLDAIISLEQALGTTPHGPALGLSAGSLADKAHHQLARLYCKTGQIPIAKQHARAAIDRNPNNIAVWQTLGTIMANAGQIDELRQTIVKCETKPWGIHVIPVLQAILEKVTTRNRPS